MPRSAATRAVCAAMVAAWGEATATIDPSRGARRSESARMAGREASRMGSTGSSGAGSRGVKRTRQCRASAAAVAIARDSAVVEQSRRAEGRSRVRLPHRGTHHRYRDKEFRAE